MTENQKGYYDEFTTAFNAWAGVTEEYCRENVGRFKRYLQTWCNDPEPLLDGNLVYVDLCRDYPYDTSSVSHYASFNYTKEPVHVCLIGESWFLKYLTQEPSPRFRFNYCFEMDNASFNCDENGKCYIHFKSGVEHNEDWKIFMQRYGLVARSGPLQQTLKQIANSPGSYRKCLLGIGTPVEVLIRDLMGVGENNESKKEN